MKTLRTDKTKSNKVLRRLGSRSGETIAETLVALLIAALALVMLASAIYTGQHIIERSQDKYTEYYAANEQIVRLQKDAGDSKTQKDTATIAVNTGDGSGDTGILTGQIFTVNVDTITNNVFKKPVTAYKVITLGQ